MSRRRSSSSLAAPYFRIYLWPFLAALACLSVESVCDLLQPTIMARIVDNGVAARDIAIVLHFGLSMLAVAGVGALGAAGRNLRPPTLSAGTKEGWHRIPLPLNRPKQSVKE